MTVGFGNGRTHKPASRGLFGLFGLTEALSRDCLAKRSSVDHKLRDTTPPIFWTCIAGEWWNRVTSWARKENLTRSAFVITR